MPKVKIEFNDEISKQLEKLAKKSPKILDNVLLKISSELSLAVDRKIRAQFEEHTGKMRKGLRYFRTGRARYQLRMPNLYSVFERGAEIFPKNAELLRWKGKDGAWYSSNWVTLEAKPFFYPTIRGFQSSGRTNLIAQKVINKELRKLRWGV